MKCPLSNFELHPSTTVEKLSPADCLKEECEWWKQSSQLCVINRLAGELYSLVEVMEEIRDHIALLVKATGIRGQ